VTPALLLDNLLLYTLQAALVAAAGLLLPLLFRLREPRAAQRWYQAVLLLVLALPLFHLFPSVQEGAVSIAFGPARFEPASALQGFSGHRPSALAAVLWLLASGSLVQLVRLLMGIVALGRRYRHSEPLTELSARDRALVARAGVRPRLLLADGLLGAQAFGFFRPAVLLPRDFASWPPPVQSSVLAHELGHLRRHDGLSVLLEELVRAALWFHPAVWLLLDRAALCREQAADAEAVALTGERRLYAETLVAVAAARAGDALVPAVPYLTRGHLVRRVALLTKEVCMDKRRLAWVLPAAGTLALAVAVLSTWAFPLVVPAAVAPPSPVAAPPPPPPPDPPAVPAGEQAPKALSRVNPVYPEAAKEKGLQGTVTVELVVDEAGKVADARVLKSTDPVFDAPSLEAVRQWTFEPPLQEGKPVRARFAVTIAFKLA